MGLRLMLFAAAVAALVAVWTFTFVSKDYEEVAAGVLPLEPQQYPRLTLVTVGSGGTFENHQRRGPAAAVGLGDALLLVDAGRGVAEALRAAGIPVDQPEAVLLTSLLPENTLGLDDLLVMRTYFPGAAPLQIVGPPGTQALVAGLLDAHAVGLAAAREGGLAQALAVEARDGSPGETIVLGGLVARAAALPGATLASYAWRIEGGGRSLLVSSLGFAPEALLEHGRGAGLWLHEALYGEALEIAIEQGAERPEVLRREAAWHTRLEDVGDLAARMGVRTLVLSRLRPPPVYDFQYRSLIEGFDGRVLLARDGLVVEP